MHTDLGLERFWVDKSRYDNAERQYHEGLAKIIRYQQEQNKCSLVGKSNCIVEHAAVSNADNCTRNTKREKLSSKKRKAAKSSSTKPRGDVSFHNGGISLNQNQHNTLVSEIAKAREHIKNSLDKMDGIATLATAPGSSELLDRVISVEKENKELKNLIQNLNNLFLESQKRIRTLEENLNVTSPVKSTSASVTAPASKSKALADDDDDVDLFASDSDEESEEAARVREERLAAYAAKKSKKPVLIAKSSLVLDVKPWDDETDLKLMEVEIRKITSDGLLWGASKFVPVAFGIQKLSISCVVEDEKVSIDWLTEEIEKLEDFVQSVDVAAFNKI